MYVRTYITECNTWDCAIIVLHPRANSSAENTSRRDGHNVRNFTICKFVLCCSMRCVLLSALTSYSLSSLPDSACTGTTNTQQRQRGTYVGWRSTLPSVHHPAHTGVCGGTEGGQSRASQTTLRLATINVRTYSRYLTQQYQPISVCKGSSAFDICQLV